MTLQDLEQIVAMFRKAGQTATAGELQQAAGLRDRVHFLKAYLGPCLKEGWIKRTIPDKPRSRLQKYRLTERGRAWLDAQRETSTP